MKKITGVLIVVVIIAVFLSMAAFAGVNDKADKLFNRAAEFEKEGSYLKAIDAYESAADEYIKNKETEKAALSTNEMVKLQRALIDYMLTQEDADKVLKETFKGLSDADRAKLLSGIKLDCIVIDGKPYYFNEFADNIFFRYPDTRRYFTDRMKKTRGFVRKYMSCFLNTPASVYDTNLWNPYINPIGYIGSFSVDIERKKFPSKGTLRIWMPAPIQTGCQRDVKIISISAQEYLKSAPRVSGEIGTAYFEIPLEKLKGDLNIKVTFSFKHYEQYFKINPENVGVYDTNLHTYKKYTSSDKNILINPEIKAKALEVVGDEKNPYIRAKKIYNYIVENINYSYTPHLFIEHMKITETMFVHKNKFGDCGSQAAYFSSLCRCLGIPARATGGMLLTPGMPSGHFWAEFYLPNYGWVPIDTTAAEAMLESDEISPSQAKTVKEYYFAHQEPYRLVIQKDMDIPVHPLQEDAPFYSATLQAPRVECKSMETDPTVFILPTFKTEITPWY